MKKYDILLFDADETLFDFTKASSTALITTLNRYGIPYPDDVWERYKRYNDQVWARFERGEADRATILVERYRMLFAELGSGADPAAFNRDYMELLSQGGDPLPGALELCREIAPHYPIYIVTNGNTSAQAGRMEHSPLKPYIAKMYISEQIGFQKPLREFFDAVLSDLAVRDRSRVLILGDSLTSDMTGGINAGIRTCWYNPERKDSGGLPIDFEIHALHEFLPLVL